MNTRNQPCPCESGLKFKHCCLPLRTAKTPDQRVDATVNQIERLSNAYGGELVADVIREVQDQGQIKPFWGTA